MTQVLVKRKDDVLISIEVEGHADFANYGNDVVCAAISAVMFGSLNALTSFKLDDARIIMNNAFIKINLINDRDIQTVARTMLIQLQTIQESYPDYIKIEIN